MVNLSIELNGQPPLQVYVKPCRERHIVMRSIDLGAMEVVRTYDELAAFNKVGSPFSIPKAALVLAGFHPDFSAEVHASLEAQLEAFGAGIEITLLSAIPAVPDSGQVLFWLLPCWEPSMTSADWDGTVMKQATVRLCWNSY